jgi:hypothetical protein
MIGEFRLRRDDGSRPKEQMPRKVITKSKEEIVQRK